MQLPGRETRLREKPIADIDALLALMIPGLLPLMDKPFLLYGHSMGAIIAYEVACRLQAARFKVVVASLSAWPARIGTMRT